MGVQGNVKQLAISGFRWLIPMIFFQALRSLYHGVLVRQNLTRHLQYASFARTLVIFPALAIGVSFVQVEGIYIAIWANMLSEIAEVAWLHRAVAKIEWPEDCQ
jgi:Na+-driven multidrug efflux pump